jgi:uncharacterized protein
MAAGMESFAQLQRQFAAHIRDPQANPAPRDVSPERMAVYTELFYRNLEQFLAKAFPVIRRILPDLPWHALVRTFMASHRCRTPLFPEIGAEFVTFLESRRDDPGLPRFLAELAHYERLEVVVALSDDELAAGIDPGADVLQHALRLSCSARAFRYQFPVHRIGPEYQPESLPASPTQLLAYRDGQDHVRFLEIDAMSYALLELVRMAPGQPAGELLQMLAESTCQGAPQQFIDAGAALLRDLCDRRILVRGELP